MNHKITVQEDEKIHERSESKLNFSTFMKHAKIYLDQNERSE